MLWVPFMIAARPARRSAWHQWSSQGVEVGLTPTEGAKKPATSINNSCC
jgi:hypothetical protein